MLHLHFLHGFLGTDQDFKPLFSAHPYYHHFYSIERFMSKDNSFQNWVKNFHNSISIKKTSNQQKNILIGYSLGGRLALHSLVTENQWAGAIIISANPGLSQEEEKKVRLENDTLWAKRFLHEPWDQLLQAWNAQGVFAEQKNNLSREEKDFNRETLAQMLLDFSLAKQKNLQEEIEKIAIPVLWIAGEKDKKFSLIAQTMAEKNPHITAWICPQAGHRVPWENTELFQEKCLEFLRRF